MAKISNTSRDRNGNWPDHPRSAPAAQIRIVEIADILAAGLMRLVARKSSQIPTDPGESSLDLSATESSHPTLIERRISDG